MAGVIHGFVLLVFLQLCFLARSSAGVCGESEIPVVRNLTELGQDSYGRPGLSHMTIAGAVHHGMKEVEVWMQTFAPNSGTPIHRHKCEEVFIALKGHGTLYLSRNNNRYVPGKPDELPIYPNATFTIPVDAVHQVKNTKHGEDLQLFVTISRPPLKAFNYKDWTTPHSCAVPEIKEWDKQEKFSGAAQQCMEPEVKEWDKQEKFSGAAQQCMEPEVKEWEKQAKFSSAAQQHMESELEDDDVMASIAQMLGTNIEDIVVSDDIR